MVPGGNVISVGEFPVVVVTVIAPSFCANVPLLRLYPPIYFGRLLVSAHVTFIQAAQLMIQMALNIANLGHQWQKILLPQTGNVQ